MDSSNGLQSALNPEGPGAHAIASLSWVMFYGGGAIFVLVMALAAFALWAPPERRRWASNKRLIIAGGVVFPLVTLTALLIYSFSLMRATAADAEPPYARIEVIAHQWWWRVRYLHANGQVQFETANEIRIPVARPVELVLKSADVIHSFWVPNLAGKLDMIPGHVNRLRLAADREGVFRGQCAEYCGGPHAQMALYVVAHTTEAFDSWRDAQQRAAVVSADAEAVRGRSLFLARCAVCHTVRGTPARGTLGPDLTHVGGRMSIAAGILPNDRASLAAWIAGSQHIKPGNLMPSMDVYTAGELRALAGYLAGLE